MSAIAFLVITFNVIHVASGSCWDGWMRYNHSCYLFQYKQVPWQDASAYCKALGARLAIIETSGEDSFLRDRALHMSSKEDYWLDGTDLVAEGSWIWASTHSFIHYMNWHPGQPDDHHLQDCLVISYSYGYTWDDESCDEPYNFICEHVDYSLNPVG